MTLTQPSDWASSTKSQSRGGNLTYLLHDRCENETMVNQRRLGNLLDRVINILNLSCTIPCTSRGDILAGLFQSALRIRPHVVKRDPFRLIWEIFPISIVAFVGVSTFPNTIVYFCVVFVAGTSGKSLAASNLLA